MKSKNLILIIGNGFDLSHKLKTSYSDFSNYLIDNEISSSILNFRKDKENSILSKNFIKILTENNFGSPEGSLIQQFTFYISQQDQQKIRTILKNHSQYIKEIIHNNFLGKLYNNEYDNWFEIENAFFKELVEIHKKSIPLNEKIAEIEILNSELINIKNYLFQYLKTIKTTLNNEVSRFFRNEFFRERDHLYIINFNYTTTIEHYITEDNINSKTKINYIHGDIDSPEIIFGYGNDKHEKYIELKNSGTNEYLRFFKTFEYLNHRNYSDIYEQALDYFQDYEVAIIGHSLSETDKTLLKEILDNSKCKKIHLYKRKDLVNDIKQTQEEFNKLIYSTSRIIDNEKDLRTKVLNSSESKSFPN
ncbi:AbiH family protein [Wenyingzhuangia sp. 1_MG-2023]|nr:AbiH family protein [Wenyingzhuangia sp. 1_MG-2023]